MKEYNLILVYDEKEENILMCKRAKEPYKGKYNLVGGKINPGEDKMDAAYRELGEETGIQRDDINLTHMLNFQYPMIGTALEVYAGKLNKDVKLIKEVNELYWINKDEDFADKDKYAGEGNIAYMVEQAKLYKDEIFKNNK
ncbi:MAG: NUDIX hydrolase [Clostridia bacterium]|nr:NUDIX hydrolase [Clostridia bacterium]